MPSHLFETFSWLSSFPHAGDNLLFNHGPLWTVVLCSVCLFLLRTAPHPLHHGNAPSERPVIAQRQSWLSKHQLMCNGKLHYYVVYLQGLLLLIVGPIYIFWRLKHRQFDLSFDLSKCYKLTFG